MFFFFVAAECSLLTASILCLIKKLILDHCTRGLPVLDTISRYLSRKDGESENSIDVPSMRASVAPSLSSHSFVIFSNSEKKRIQSIENGRKYQNYMHHYQQEIKILAIFYSKINKTNVGTNSNQYNSLIHTIN